MCCEFHTGQKSGTECELIRRFGVLFPNNLNLELVAQLPDTLTLDHDGCKLSLELFFVVLEINKYFQ